MGGMAGGATSGGGGPIATDLATGKPATADSEEGDNTAERGNDRDTGTRWCAADGELEHHWTVDLGQTHTLEELKITFEFAGRRYGYVIEGSSDDDTYEMLLDRTNNPAQTQVQTEPLNGSARYLRIRFVALPENTWASFYELKVMGT